MGGYENMSSMNHFILMEMDDGIDFSYLNYFVKYGHNKHYILQPFMFMLQ